VASARLVPARTRNAGNAEVNRVRVALTSIAGNSAAASVGDGLPGGVHARDCEILDQPLDKGLGAHEVDRYLLLLAHFRLDGCPHAAVIGQHDDGLTHGNRGLCSIDAVPYRAIAEV
jgi:hypothetical protein